MGAGEPRKPGAPPGPARTPKSGSLATPVNGSSTSSSIPDGSMSPTRERRQVKSTGQPGRRRAGPPDGRSPATPTPRAGRAGIPSRAPEVGGRDHRTPKVDDPLDRPRPWLRRRDRHDPDQLLDIRGRHAKPPSPSSKIRVSRHRLSTTEPPSAIAATARNGPDRPGADQSLQYSLRSPRGKLVESASSHRDPLPRPRPTRSGFRVRWGDRPTRDHPGATQELGRVGHVQG